MKYRLFPSLIIRFVEKDTVHKLFFILLGLILSLDGKLMYATEPMNEETLTASEDRRFVIFKMLVADVLVPIDERDLYGLSAFERVGTEGSFTFFEDDPLFVERVQRLQTYFKIGDDFSFLDDTEQAYIEKIIESATNLLRYSHPHLLLENNPIYKITYQQLARTIMLYLEYRMKGIRRHLNTGNVEDLYSFRECSFSDHKAQQELAISSFEKQGNVRIIRKQLKKLAPSFEENSQESFSEYIAGPQNSFDNHFVKFETPPGLADIKKMLEAVIYLSRYSITNNAKFITEHRITLQNSIDSLTQLQGYVSSYGYIKLHATVEKLAQFSLNNESWNNHQKAFWEKQPIALLMGVGKTISYEYEQVDESKLKKIIKAFNSGDLSTSEECIQAHRYIYHCFIKWIHLKRLGLLAFHANKLERPFHLNIFLDASRELIPELKDVILPRIESWLSFEMTAATGNKLAEPNKSDSLPLTPTLTLLSRYTADVAYLTKLDETLSELKDLDTLPIPALLRILSIFGEVGKNISEYAKNKMNKFLWDNLIEIRDKLHHSKYYFSKLTQIFDETPALMMDLMEELKKLAIQVNGLLANLPTTWDQIKENYNEENQTAAAGQFSDKKGFYKLFGLLWSNITQEDYTKLRDTKKSRVTGVIFHRDEILRSISSVDESLAISSTIFNDHLNELTQLSKTDKKRISEFYKKLRGGGRKKYLIKEALTQINEGSQGTPFLDRIEKLQKLKMLFKNEKVQSDTSEEEWVKFLENLYDNKEKQRILTAIKAIYSPVEIEKEEAEENKKCIDLLNSEKVSPTNDEAWDQEVEDLIQKLNQFTTPAKEELDSDEKDIKIHKSLSLDLDKLGIKNKEPWEIIRRKIHARSEEKSAKKSPEIQELFSQKRINNALKNSRDAISKLFQHFEALDLITKDPNGDLGRVTLENFWNDPKLHLSVAHHIEVIRQYAEVIAESIQYLIRYDIRSPFINALNNFYHVLSLKTKKLRLAGNYFAHLHDVTEYESRTYYGLKLDLFTRSLYHVDGIPYNRRGNQVSYLPSLMRELETYANILNQTYAQFETSEIQSSIIKQTTPTVFNAIFGNQPIRFEEIEVLGDGDCGFTALSLTRNSSIQQLITKIASNDELSIELVNMVCDDAKEAFRGRDLPPKLRAKFSEIATRFDEQEDIVTTICRDLNDRYAKRQRMLGITINKSFKAEELATMLETDEDPETLVQIDALKEALNHLGTIQQEIFEQLSSPKTLIEFLQEEFLQGGRYLSYVRGSYGTLYALAHLNNFEVHIWTKNVETNNLVENFMVPARTLDTSFKIIHLYHTNYGRELNHFNKLKILL